MLWTDLEAESPKSCHPLQTPNISAPELFLEPEPFWELSQTSELFWNPNQSGNTNILQNNVCLDWRAACKKAELKSEIDLPKALGNEARNGDTRTRNHSRLVGVRFNKQENLTLLSQAAAGISTPASQNFKSLYRGLNCV